MIAGQMPQSEVKRGTYADSPQPGQIRIYAGAEAGNKDHVGNTMQGSVVQERYLVEQSGSSAIIEAYGSGYAAFERYGWHKKITKRTAMDNGWFTYSIPFPADTPAPIYISLEASGYFRLIVSNGKDKIILFDTGEEGFSQQTPMEFTLQDQAIWSSGSVDIRVEHNGKGEGAHLYWLEAGRSSLWRDRLKKIVWDVFDVVWQIGYYDGTGSEFRGNGREITMPGGDIDGLLGKQSITVKWDQSLSSESQYCLLIGVIGGEGKHNLLVNGNESSRFELSASQEKIYDLQIVGLIHEGENRIDLEMAPEAVLDFCALLEVREGCTPESEIRVVFKGSEIADNWTKLANTTMYFHNDMMVENSTGFIDASLPNGIFPLLYWVADSGPAMLEMARWGYFDVAKQATLFRSAENHYKGDNGAAGLVFSTIAYLIKADNYKGDYVKQAWPILKEGLDYYSREIRNSPYTLLKGTGLESTDMGYGIYNNSIAYYSLLAGQDIAQHIGEESSHLLWLKTADMLFSAISRYLCFSENTTWHENEFPSGTWRYSLHGDKQDGSDTEHVKAGWFGIGSQEELYYGYKTPDTSRNKAVSLWRSITDATMDYHSHKLWAHWRLYGHNRGFGTDYGVLSERGGWPLSAMFMSDRMAMAKKNIEHIIWNSVDLHFAHGNEGVQETSPWLLVREVNRFDNGIADTDEIGNGNFNEDMNLVEYIITLKNVRIMAGIDDSLESGDNVMLIPRLPWGWSGVSINRWPVRSRGEDSEVIRNAVSYDYLVHAWGAEMKIEVERPIQGMMIRMGPFHSSSSILSLRINGESNSEYTEQLRGDALWVWLKLDAGIGEITIKTELKYEGLVYPANYIEQQSHRDRIENDNDVERLHQCGMMTKIDEWSVDIKMYAGAAGIYCRSEGNEEDGFMLLLDKDAGHEGSVCLKDMNGKSLSTEEMNVNIGRTYSLKVLIKENRASWTLNGVALHEMSVAGWRPGIFGLYVKGSAEFSNRFALGDKR